MILKEEMPENIIGKSVCLKSIECGPNGLVPYITIDAVVKSYKNSQYGLKFLSDIEINSVKENYAWISARHVEAPISQLSKDSVISVNGKFGSGASFIANINLCK